jgi:hypothetical protein
MSFDTRGTEHRASTRAFVVVYALSLIACSGGASATTGSGAAADAASGLDGSLVPSPASMALTG